MEIPNPPPGPRKLERYLVEVVIPAIKTLYAIAGVNVTISDFDTGQVINANDCPPCP